jgi:hypothetical protein
MKLFMLFAVLGLPLIADAARGSADAIREVKAVGEVVNNNSPEANKLRTNLALLAGKMAGLANSTPQSLDSKTKAQGVSGAIDSVVNSILQTSVMSSVQAAESITGGVSRNAYLSGLFVQQGGNASVWDSYILPQVLTTFIRIQASYASALLSYISRNIERMHQNEIETLNSLVQAQINNLSNYGA